jgi:hypothetical protein
MSQARVVHQFNPQQLLTQAQQLFKSWQGAGTAAASPGTAPGGPAAAPGQSPWTKFFGG